ncbi:hypothetical protein PRNP1_011678 [Phytophthora ramorum]
MAFPFSMGFAPMSEEEQAEFMENTVDDIEEVQEQEARTQEEMIQRFKNMRAMFVRPGGFFAEQMMRGEFPSDTVQVGFSLNADTKPKSSMRPLRTLKPMTVQELDLGTTHRGRYLCGWVAIDDAFFGISSSSLLLEDVTGRLVEIAAYGLVETDLPPTQRQRALASGFPKGKPIAVIEPYYKVRMDGSVGIRVDDAQEVVPWRDVPTDLISWKKLGNEYFSALNTQNQGRGALACYQRSIEAVQPEAHTIAVLLSNLATCRFKMGDYVSSIQLSEYLGFTDEECTTDLQSIRSSVLSNTFPLTQNTQRVQEFKNIISADIQRGLQRSSNSETAQQDGNMPSSVHRVKKDVCRPPSATSGQVKPDENIPPDALHGADDESIDDYIARVEGFVKRTHFAFSVAKSMSNPQLQELPREITMFFENSPPQIHIEFPKLCGWPDGIDPTFARKVLYRAYLDANVNPWIPAHTMRNGTFFESIDFSDRVKRWHGTEAMEILHSRRFVKYGDIVDGREAQKDYVPEYEARVRYNFANNPSRAEVYYFGTTHVAIGFTDFSSLLAATLHDNLHNGEPLKFVGFDMSEFAVAKCKVVAQMLKSSDVSIWSVMEVWLSSVWSGTTLKDFRKSVTALLGSLRGQNENVKVVSYLRRWASAETISSAKAHSDFFLNLERCNRKVLPLLCCFRREIDRLKLMQYMLTGEIRASSIVADLVEKERVGAANITTSAARPAKKKRNRKKKKQHAKRGSATASSSTPLVGSLTMWNVPDGSPPLEADIALNAVDFMKLLEDCKERETKQKNSTEKLSVVDLFVIHTVKNLLRLRGLMLANKLTIQVHYGVVKAVRGDPPYNHENQELLERIATMRPDTISWSNVLDYFLPKDFHDLARRCSTYGGCVHYGYSMNWSTQVFGASIIDYGVGDNKQAIDAIIDSALGFSSELMGLSLLSSVTMFKVTGLDKLLYLPFREHPLNSTGYVLAQMFNEEWIEHFMTEGQITLEQRLGTSYTQFNCGLQMGAMELAIPGPLYRSSLTLHMSWCYDPGVRLVTESSEAPNAEILAQLMEHLGVLH